MWKVGDTNDSCIRGTQAGDQIDVLTVGDVNGWWQGKIGETVGWFPSAYMEGNEEAPEKIIALSKEEELRNAAARVRSEAQQESKDLDAFESLLKGWRPR